MEQRPLGRTGLSVSAIGFGAASFWGHPAFREADAVRLVHRALDLGVTLFDTGPAYSRGQAEARLGVTRVVQGRTELVAPFDGIIAKIVGEVGEYSTPSPPGSTSTQWRRCSRSCLSTRLVTLHLR